MSHISGYTHTYYKYPARFSPQFARAAIESFTEPGDLILDPFMGGGTTLVEALALGRRATGTDISSLAVFVSSAKTNLLSVHDRKALNSWMAQIDNNIKINRGENTSCTEIDIHYQRNLHNPEAWRIRKGLKLGIESLENLKNARQVKFARCALLKTGQWALDGKKTIPSISEFRDTLTKYFESMLKGEMELRSNAYKNAKHTIASSRQNIKWPAPDFTYR